MSELQGPINVEYELKYVTDRTGLKEAMAWLASEVGPDLGYLVRKRSHCYHDTSRYTLCDIDWSFRQRIGRYSYCLKYPLESSGNLLVRREVFAVNLDFPLDIRNNFHQRSPTLCRVLSRLSLEDKLKLEEFVPRIRIDCVRHYRFVLDKYCIDRAWGAAFDEITSYSCSNNEIIKTWCEVEFETGWGFPERIDLIKEIGERMAKEVEMRPTLNGKYKLARIAAAECSFA